MMARFGPESTGLDVVTFFKDQIVGKTFVITGPRHGAIGGETAMALCRGRPKQLLLLGRNRSSIDPVMTAIQSEYPEIKVDFVKCDLSSQKSIRSAARQVLSMTTHVDVLINNAATLPLPYSLTEDGIESQFGTNHIGHFLLTNLLLQNMVDHRPEARVIMVSSSAHRYASTNFDDYNFTHGKTYDEWSGYVQSKAANVLFAQTLAWKVSSRGVAAFSVHPGSIPGGMHDQLSKEALEVAGLQIQQLREREGREPQKTLRKSVQQGSATTLVAALDPGLSEASGAYLVDGAVSSQLASEAVLNRETGQALWLSSERLVNQKFDW